MSTLLGYSDGKALFWVFLFYLKAIPLQGKNIHESKWITLLVLVPFELPKDFIIKILFPTLFPTP